MVITHCRRRTGSCLTPATITRLCWFLQIANKTQNINEANIKPSKLNWVKNLYNIWSETNIIDYVRFLALRISRIRDMPLSLICLRNDFPRGLTNEPAAYNRKSKYQIHYAPSNLDSGCASDIIMHLRKTTKVWSLTKTAIVQTYVNVLFGFTVLLWECAIIFDFVSV